MTILGIALIALTLQNADTTAPAVAVESPYTIHSGALELGGTLTLPRAATGRIPVAVIIAGSGPTDRNGNSLMGIRPNSYAQLAWRLAERGIATLRYDKRGMPGTKGTFDMTKMTLDDFAADARVAAESLAHDARFSRVVLLGHSEGSSLALMAARQGPPVVGVISVSGLGRPFGVVLREQLTRQFDSATLVRYDTAMAQYLRGEQVTVADAERLRAARPDAQLVVVPLANHVLKQTTDTTLQGQMPTYQNPTVPIMPAVASAIADWILRLRS